MAEASFAREGAGASALRKLVAFFVLLACVLCSMPASAQDELGERRKAAQALANNAFDLMQESLFKASPNLSIGAKIRQTCGMTRRPEAELR